MECGNSLSWDLDPDAKGKAGIAKWFNSHGTMFPEHVHESREWIIVLEGSIQITIRGKEPRRLNYGQSLIIEPNTPHSAYFYEDCWYYAITIPRDKNWPE
jgi:quercetin dioxygenase-like cupin family protein